jgi:hypothetical protein
VYIAQDNSTTGMKNVLFVQGSLWVSQVKPDTSQHTGKHPAHMTWLQQRAASTPPQGPVYALLVSCWLVKSAYDNHLSCCATVSCTTCATHAVVHRQSRM